MPAALARATTASASSARTGAPAPIARTASSVAAAAPPALARARVVVAAAAPPAFARARGVVAAAAANTSSSSSAPAPNPARQFIGGVVSAIYKMQAPKETDPRLAGSPLWTAIERLDEPGVRAALRQGGASPDERSPVTGETPLAMIAKRGGHYKYPPQGIPAALIDAGADLEIRDPETGHTAFELSLLKGWQNISYLLLDRGAKTTGVDAALKARLTCPDCKRLVAEKGL